MRTDPAGVPGPRKPGQTGGPIDIVCVDTYELARLGVEYLARRYPDLRVVGTAATVEQAREVIALTRPAVVLIGDGMPGAGRRIAAALRADQPRLGLVAVSHRTDDRRYRNARDAGMTAFVSRSAPATATVAAIRHAAAAPASFRTFGVPFSVERDADRAPVLSERERQVLALIGDGLSNEDIAAALRVGRGTVRTHLTRMYSKLHVNNRSQALVAAGTGGQRVGAGSHR